MCIGFVVLLYTNAVVSVVGTVVYYRGFYVLLYVCDTSLDVLS